MFSSMHGNPTHSCRFGSDDGRLPTVALLVTLLCLNLFFGSAVVAEPRRPTLEPGFLPGDVAARWGSPSDKLEYEVSRGELWRYPPATTLRFREGRLVREASSNLMSEGMSGQRETADVRMPTLRNSPSSPSTMPQDEDVEEILTEIMDNFPSGTDSGAGSALPSIPAPPAMAPLMGGELYSPDGGPFSGSD